MNYTVKKLEKAKKLALSNLNDLVINAASADDIQLADLEVIQATNNLENFHKGLPFDGTLYN